MTTKLTSNLPNLLESLGIPWMHGDNIRCPCPVHGGNDNNFMFFTQTGQWKCWSHQCHEIHGSDLIGLICGVQGCTKEQAKTYAYGVVLDRPIKKEHHNDRTNKPIDPKLLFEQSHIVPYFIKRGFSIKTLEEFKVFLCVNPKKKLYNRAVVPLFDENNQLIGFTGRTLTNSPIKWMHAPKSLIKGNILYAMNIAKHHLNSHRTICLVEGVTDVWRLHEAGIKNSVGLLGSSITQNQIKMLQHFGVKKIILIMDPDGAGMSSMLRPGGLCGKLSEHFEIHSLRHFLTDDIGDTPIKDINNVVVPEILRIMNVKSN